MEQYSQNIRATQAQVKLDCDPDKITLKVSDNGAGFNKRNLSLESMGLGIMKERAEAVGAILEILSRKGRGTTIIVKWMKKSKEEA